MNFIKQISLFLIVALFLLSCDEKVTTPQNTLDIQPIRSISLDPQTANFTPDMGAKDTTVSINITLEVNPDDLYDLMTQSNQQNHNSDTPPPSPVAEIIIRNRNQNEARDRFIVEDYNPETQQFQVNYPFPTRTVDIGDYRFYAKIIEPSSSSSATVQSVFKVRGFSSGQPVIESIVAPDTVFIPSQSTIQFEIGATVTHTFDNDLIDGVFTDLYDADGNRLDNDSFRLNPDEDENYYFRIFEIGPNNQQDDIRVEIFAFDIFGVSSDTLITNFVIR